jgi:hypothetical protein
MSRPALPKNIAALRWSPAAAAASVLVYVFFGVEFLALGMALNDILNGHSGLHWLLTAAGAFLVAGVIFWPYRQRRFSDVIVIAYNVDGSISPHFHWSAFGTDGSAAARYSQMVQVMSFARSVGEAVRQGLLRPDQPIRVISSLADPRLMTRAGFTARPTNPIELRLRTAAYWFQAALAFMRGGRRIVRPNAANWRLVWRATAGDVAAARTRRRRTRS